jgi:hypothetical protein
MQPIVITQSRTKWIVFLAGALCFVAGGILFALVETGIGRVLAWTNILFFGGCALVFAHEIADRRPRIEISDRGIEDRTLKVGVIDWADIGSVALRRSFGNAFIGLELRDPAKYTARLSPLLQRTVALNSKLGFPPLSLNLAGTSVSPERIEELLRNELAVRSRGTAV